MRQLLLIFTLICASYMSVNAQTNTWTGAGANTNWNTVANWSLNLVPTAAHDVVIPTGFTVNLNVVGTTNSIVIQGNSTLNLSNNLSILNASSLAANATVNWSSGSLIGGGTLTNNGTIIMSSGGSRYITTATTLVNNGLVSMPGGGYFYLYDTSVFNNTVNGIFDFQSDAVISYGVGDEHNFINAGLLRKSGGVNNSTISATLTNTGTISIESGGIVLNSLEKMFIDGIYNVETASQLIVNTTVHVDGTLTGELDGAITWNNNLSVESSVTFDFTGDTQVNWNSGSLLGGGTLTNESTIQLTGGGSRYISDGTTLINNGLVTMPGGGYFYLYDTSIFNNPVGGVFDFQSDAVVSYGVGVNHNFINAGLLRKTGGENNATFSAILTNTGTISIQSGGIAFNTLEKMFTNGIYNVEADSQIIANATIHVDGTLTGELDGAFTWNSNLSVESSVTFEFTGDTQVNWYSGSLLGGGTLINESNIQMTEGGSRYISDDTSLINNGLVTMPGGGYFYLYDTSVFNNTAIGIFDFQSDAVVSYGVGDEHNFINAGLLRKTGGASSAVFAAKLANTSTISVESGAIVFNTLEKMFTDGIYNVEAESQLIVNTTIHVDGTLTGELDGAITWNTIISVASEAIFDFTGDTQVNWNSGSLIGGGTLTNESNIQMTGGGSRYISGGTTLINNGLVTMPGGGYFYLYDTSIFNNSASGVFDFQSDAVISYGVGAEHNFINAGLLRKTGGENNATFSATLNNTGTISIESGGLSLSTLAKNFNGGIYNVMMDSQLIFNVVINIDGVLTGTLDGAITWNSDVSVATTASFNFIGDTQVNWNAGSLIGGGILTNMGNLQLASAGSRYITSDTTLINNGLVTMPGGGYFYLYDTSIFSNTSAGTFDIQSDAVISYGVGAAHGFNNSGLLQKTGGENNATFSATLNNSGTISIESGGLSLSTLAKNFNGGVYNVMMDSQLLINVPVNVTGLLTGELNGALVWNSDVAVASEATFDFTGDTGIHWNSGSLLGGGTLTNNGDIHLNSAGSRYISGTVTTLSNAGTINFVAGGYLYLYDSTTLHNQLSGIIDFQTNAIVSHSGSGAYSINNEGLFQKTGGTGTTTISPPVTNSGSISITSGELEFNGALTNTEMGIVTGIGTIDLPTAANYIDAGTFAPGGSPGTLSVIGDFESTSTSVLKVELYGLTPDTDYDVLDITGNAMFEGTVNVTLGFESNLNDEFVIATTSGTINQCNLASTATAEYNGMLYTFNVICRNDTEVVLTVINITLGFEEYGLTEASVSLYPNPVNDVLTIKNTNQLPLNSIQIIDITGKVLQTVSLQNMALSKEISFQNYASGMYFVQINGLDSSITKRIVKQ